MTIVATAPPETSGATELRVGRAFARTFVILQRHLLPFLLITAVAALPPLLAGLRDALHLGLGSPALTKLLTPAANILSFLLTTASQAIVLYGTFQDMRGRPFSLGDTLRPGLARIMPVLGVTICTSLAIGLASIALIVPGLMLAASLYVALPVCVVERLGVSASMGRSSRLTKGHRWRVFGIILVTALVTGMVSAVINGISEASGWSILGAVSDFIWSTFTAAFEAIIAVVVYHDLRVIKEGIDVEQIAAVFD